MPLNTLRLNNAPSSHPNDRIVFIKPLPRPQTERKDYETADLLLRAIAAQCLPIMKSNHLSVTTLEEHEPNPEFIGRNFNNGEIIQLVLRSRTGRWLSVGMIQMVMMHELAHNLQMNHSKKFWEVRNKFATEMRGLWAKGYTGDGLWGSGRLLGDLNGAMVTGNGVIQSDELKDLPLCGGTFRSRRRKRKRKPRQQELSWKEKKEKRIEKKFGKNGVALGEDEDKRLRLDILAKGPLGVKPRVAQSKRGRDLRAAAALARLEASKRETEAAQRAQDAKQQEYNSQDDEGEESSEYEDVDGDQEDAKDVNGERLLDKNGQGMIRVCADDDEDNVNIKQEMDELEDLDMSAYCPIRTDSTDPSQFSSSGSSKSQSELLRCPTNLENLSSSPTGQKTKPTSKLRDLEGLHPARPPIEANKATSGSIHIQGSIDTKTPFLVSSESSTVACPICTTINPRSAPTCSVCANVLDRRKDPRHWHCQSKTCEQSEYINAGDCGICGICGQKK